MSEELIASMKKHMAWLEDENFKLKRSRSEAARAERQSTTEEVEKLRREVESLTKERDQVMEKLRTTPNEHAARMSEIEAENSGLKHQNTFTTAALKHGVKPESVEDLYKLSGLKPGTEPATVESFAEHLTEAKASRAWAFGVTPPPAGQQVSPRGQLGASPPPAGSGRSASDIAASKVYYTRRDVVGTNWQKVRPELAEAIKNGSAQMVDG